MSSRNPKILYYNPLLNDSCWDVGDFRSREMLHALSDLGITGAVASPRLSCRGRLGRGFELFPLPRSPIERAKSLLKIARNGDYSIVQERFQGGDVMSNGYGLMVHERVGIPFVSELHNIGKPLAILKTLHFLPASLIRSSIILSYSSPMGYPILAAGGSRFVRVPNGYSKRVLDSIRGQESSTYDLQMRTGHRMVFGYFGGLTSAKGVRLLLDVARLFENDQRLCFAFAGRGPMEREIHGQAALPKSNVVFLGLLSRQETLACMSQCRGTFAVYDAYQSKLGNSVKTIESIAVDVPPITSSILEIPSDLRDKCVRVAERNPDAVANAVRAIADSPRTSILDSRIHEYSVERIAQRILCPIYLSIAN